MSSPPAGRVSRSHHIFAAGAQAAQMQSDLRTCNHDGQSLLCAPRGNHFYGCSASKWNSWVDDVEHGRNTKVALASIRRYHDSRLVMETSDGVAPAVTCARCEKLGIECKVFEDGRRGACAACFLGGRSVAQCGVQKDAEEENEKEDPAGSAAAYAAAAAPAAAAAAPAAISAASVKGFENRLASLEAKSIRYYDRIVELMQENEGLRKENKGLRGDIESLRSRQKVVDETLANQGEFLMSVGQQFKRLKQHK